MGLDIAEAFIALEEEFEMDIPEADFQAMENLGQLVDYLSLRLAQSPRSWVEQEKRREETTEEIRSLLASQLNIDRESIRPATTLESLLPRGNRRKQWKAIQKAAGKVYQRHLPELQPTRLFHGATLLLTLVGGGAFAALAVLQNQQLLIFLPILLLLGYGCSVFLCVPLCTRVPATCETVEQLVQKLVGPICSYDPEKVEQAVIAIFSESMGIEPRKISRETRFSDLV